mmetsp:Transcript_46757/g.116526  ORF Transcript_46757/g.116526 Transcript_46757/m.116526 type:complete len:200 (-) Transcript_46757:2112-2711(-)
MESPSKRRRLSCAELESIASVMAGVRGRYEHVLDKINALDRQASEALTLRESQERTLGKDMCPNVAKMVCLDYERFKVLLSKIGPADNVTPSTQDILINIAQQKLSAMTHNLHLDSLAPSLLTLPDALLFDRLGPLVGTESIIGDSRGPIRHTWDPPAAPTCTPPSHSSPTATSTPPISSWRHGGPVWPRPAGRWYGVI